MTRDLVATERNALRQRMRSARRALEDDAARSAAQRLAQRMLGVDVFSGPGRLATYLPTDGEIDPNAALGRLVKRGWQIHLPVIDRPDVQVPERIPADPPTPGPSMAFAPWRPGESLRPNRFGIGEPPTLRTVGADRLDVVIVPAVAVDMSGHRLGFGAGYYDRALAVRDEDPSSGGSSVAEAGAAARPWSGRGGPLVVAVVHDLQLVDDVMPQPWDVAADVVLTDERVLDLRRSSAL